MVQLQLVVVTACIGFGRAHSNSASLLSAAKVTDALKCAKETTQRVDCYPPRANFPDPTEELCLAQGCCWKSLENEGIPCAFALEEPPNNDKCNIVAKPARFACRNPRFAAAKVLEDEDSCRLAGCCFDDGDCFQPMNDGYELLTLAETPNGWRGTLALRHGGRGPFGNDAPLLELNVVRESMNQVRIRITDPAFPRYEVPDLPVRRQDSETSNIKNTSDYEVHFTPWPFGVAVTRRDSGEVLFNSTPPIEREDQGASFSGLVFENQFLEISTQLSKCEDEEPILYGLGERLGSARLHVDKGGDLYPMFARASNATAPVHSRSGGDNLNGVHPFVLQMEGGQSTKAHGIFMLSSNAMEVVARRDALTYRLTGGILDVFIFSGPTPRHVVEQYTDIVGRPAMPPYWALGYHVGLGGEGVSLDDAVNVVTKLRLAGVPMDAYWQDFEYMKSKGRALSLDEDKFPYRNMRAFVDDMHFHSQYFMCVQVPSITLYNTSSEMESTSGKMAKYSAEVKVDSSLLRRHPLLDTSHIRSSEEDSEEFREEKRDASGRDEGCHSDVSDQDARSNSEDRSAHGDSRDRSCQRARYDERDWDPVVRGEELDIFVKGVNGERYAQKAFRSRWVVFVDFFHPKASQYWREQLAKFHKYVIPFDGLWLDMNEPSSSCDCSLAAESDMCDDVCTERYSTGVVARDEIAELEQVATPGDGGFIRTNDVNFPFDPYRQPFAPGQNEPKFGGHGNLNSATLPMAALHYSSLHYNLHSLYGHAQACATREALDSIVKKRSVLLSRSTFSGTGRYAGHWLSDDAEASWEQLRLSISGTVQMNLLGIPLSGPNVCGSRGQSSAELCVRWHQAASFLPLLRNHAISDRAKQTPVDFDAEALNILRSTLLQRYRYLPYIYTLFYEAHRSGNPVVRPLSFEFPDDKIARGIEYQYLVGPALMVSPVVHRGAISAEVYFPNAHWFDARDGKLALSLALGNNRRVSLLTPLSKLQVHLRGGFIVPTQHSLTTTALSRREGFTLLAALSLSHGRSSAFGELYMDDGDSLSAIEDHRYSVMNFNVWQNSSDSIEFKNSITFYGYDGPEMHADLTEVRIYGVRGDGFAANSSMDATLLSTCGASTSPQSPVKAEFFAQSEMLVLSRFNGAIGQEFHVKVVARPAATSKGGNEAGSKSVGANASENSEGGEEGEDGQGARGKESEKSAKKRFSITSIVGIVVGCAFLAAIVLIFLLRRRRQGYETV